MAKPKVNKRNPQQRLIAAIIRHYGHPAACTRMIEEKTKVKLGKQTLINYTVRGLVPLKDLLFMSDVLKVEPYCLNFAGYTEMIRKEKDWKKVVMDCKILLPATRREILEGK